MGHTPESEQSHLAALSAKEGGILLYPSDTVWGLGCDATQSEAVQRLFALKQRDPLKPMLVLVSTDRMLMRLFPNLPEVGWQILDYATKPTTLILDDPRWVAPELRAPDGSLGVRWVKSGFCHQLIEKMRVPLVSTSANFAGQPTPKSFAEIDPQLCQKADYVVHLPHESKAAPPSTLIKLTSSAQVTIIRP